jgi:TatD DNase family protein
MIDFHCHLDLYPEPHLIFRQCVERNVYVLSVTTTPSAFPGTSSLANGAGRIRTALGLHPQLAHERRSELALFERLLPQTRYVGEVGLDGTPEFRRHWADQLAVFTRVLQICDAAGGRILSIHSRRAASAVLDALEKYPGAGVPVLHWFSGTARELRRAIDLGCWFSVGPPMLLSGKGQSLTVDMPRDRILTETDGPFATLEHRSLLPWDVDRAVIALSDLWAEPVESVAHQLSLNLKHLVAVPSSNPM